MSKRTLKSIVLSGDIRNIESFLDKALFTIFLGNMETAFMQQGDWKNETVLL